MAVGKTALITGGASGFGKATAERFLAAGWSVAIADINGDSCAKIKREWSSKNEGWGRNALVIKADVSSERDVQNAVGEVEAKFGRLDCMVNNAGLVGAFGAVTDIDVEDWDFTFAVLMRGVFLGTKHAARLMKKDSQGGAIINIASIAGVTGGVAPHAYSAAKAAIISFTRVAAAELASHRIRVNAVSPGVIATPLVSTFGPDVPSAMKDVQPWPEPGKPSHIAELVFFLAQDAAEFIIGENVVVDGGLLAAGLRIDEILGAGEALKGKFGVNRGTTGFGSVVRNWQPRP